jgi:hypothetical protein
LPVGLTDTKIVQILNIRQHKSPIAVPYPAGRREFRRQGRAKPGKAGQSRAKLGKAAYCESRGRQSAKLIFNFHAKIRLFLAFQVILRKKSCLQPDLFPMLNPWCALLTTLATSSSSKISLRFTDTTDQCNF